MTEVERADDLEARHKAPARELETAFFEDVEPHETQIADVLLHEIGDVVVAEKEHVERHVLAEREELIFTARDPQAAAREQIERGGRQAT